MFGKMGSIAFISFIVLMLIGMSSANPVIGKKSFFFLKSILNIEHDKFYVSILFEIKDSAGDYEIVNLCLRNCGQCKKMYGSYFEGNYSLNSSYVFFLFPHSSWK